MLRLNINLLGGSLIINNIDLYKLAQTGMPVNTFGAILRILKKLTVCRLISHQKAGSPGWITITGEPALFILLYEEPGYIPCTSHAYLFISADDKRDLFSKANLMDFQGQRGRNQQSSGLLQLYSMHRLQTRRLNL